MKNTLNKKNKMLTDSEKTSLRKECLEMALRELNLVRIKGEKSPIKKAEQYYKYIVNGKTK